MSQFTPILQSLKKENYSSKRQLLEYLFHAVKRAPRSPQPLTHEDKEAILAYAYSEIDTFLADIPAAASYKEKALIFACEDILLGLTMHLCPNADEIPQEQFMKIQLLVALVEKERYIETFVDHLFGQDSISAQDIKQVLSMVNQTEEEYQKGLLYLGLVHYKDDLSKLSDEARVCITGHLSAEMKRYLSMETLDEDCINCLEVMADISRHFADETIISLLYKVLNLGYSNINFYAVDTLLSLGKEISSETILALAKNLEYANLAYRMLKKFGKQGMFPKECSTPEYLAKSDLVHWLMYPTELGKAPDEIDYLGKITYLLKKDVYYVFKYRSDSDTLGDDLKNKWLIGWSSEDGGTFSNFDEYALYEKSSTEATLKNIKKKLLG